MKLYTLTISAHVDDLETLDVHLDANVEISDPSMQSIALSIIPAPCARSLTTQSDSSRDRRRAWPVPATAGTAVSGEEVCPACAGAMPAHHMGAPLQAAHAEHVTSPARGGPDTAGMREALAEALHTKDGEDGSGRECPACTEDADALLPVVQRLAVEKAAEELRAAADWLAGEGPDGSLPEGCAPDHTNDGLSWREDVEDRDSALDWCQMSLRDRAAALAAAAQPTDGRTGE